MMVANQAPKPLDFAHPRAYATIDPTVCVKPVSAAEPTEAHVFLKARLDPSQPLRPRCGIIICNCDKFVSDGLKARVQGIHLSREVNVDYGQTKSGLPASR
jgi:hypothetical protein